MSSTEIAVIVIGVLAIAALGAAWFLLRRRSLRRRFGPECDRLLAERESRRDAERELRDRERRHAELELRPPSDESRSRYAAEWADVQARFVDAPSDAVAAGDELVTRRPTASEHRPRPRAPTAHKREPSPRTTAPRHPNRFCAGFPERRSACDP